MKTLLPGLLLSAAVAICAYLSGKMLPIVGGAVFGIFFGIVINNTIGKPKASAPGIAFASKKLLQWAIIALGSGLSLTQVYSAGTESFVIILLVLLTAFIIAFGIGKLMKVPNKLINLIGVGTAICGGSAIAAVAPIIEAEDKDIAYAISTIFMFNVAAVLLFPSLGRLLGLADGTFGLWAGTAINDTSSVVAAGYAYSNAAGAYATIVKLTRATMIIPVSLVFAFATAVQKKKQAASKEVNFSMAKIFPWFIVWFMLASLLNTFGIITPGAAKIITEAGKFMIIIALSAIGLNSDFRKMMKTGFRPMLLGLAAWVGVALVSILAVI